MGLKRDKALCYRQPDNEKGFALFPTLRMRRYVAFLGF